jgi:hypothetical protein
MQDSMVFHADAAFCSLAAQRSVRTNLIYPVLTEEPAIAGIGCLDNRHLRDFVESIVENLGDLAADANGSGSRRVETLSENLGCVCRESA